MAQGRQIRCAADELLRGHPEIVFLIVGGGQPYQPRQMLKQSLSLPDVHWLSLEPRLEGLIVHSKFYGIAAAGRPTIAVGASDGEIANLVQHYQCGLAIAVGNGAGMASAILNLSRNREELRRMGHNARKMVDEHFGRRRSLEAWGSLLQRVTVF